MKPLFSTSLLYLRALIFFLFWLKCLAVLCFTAQHSHHWLQCALLPAHLNLSSRHLDILIRIKQNKKLDFDIVQPSVLVVPELDCATRCEDHLYHCKPFLWEILPHTSLDNLCKCIRG